MNKLKILFLAANPQSSPLQLDKEAREIIEKIRASKYRDSLELITRSAMRPDDFQQYLLETEPQILHFSGHGSPHGELFFLDNEGNATPVSKEAVDHLLSALKNNVRVVFLNACYSRPQAEAVTEYIDCAVGMNEAIGDNAAILFAGSFYRALGFGRSVMEAFELGRSALLLGGIPEDKTPKLIVRKGVDASRIVLIRKQWDRITIVLVAMIISLLLVVGIVTASRAFRTYSPDEAASHLDQVLRRRAERVKKLLAQLPDGIEKKRQFSQLYESYLIALKELRFVDAHEIQRELQTFVDEANELESESKKVMLDFGPTGDQEERSDAYRVKNVIVSEGDTRARLIFSLITQDEEVEAQLKREFDSDPK